MQEKTFFRISLLVAIGGLVFLLLYSQKLAFKPSNSLKTIQPEEQVQLRGIIKQLSVQDKAIFLELEGEMIETTDVIIFTDENTFLHQGDYVDISGTVENYKGKKEVVASKVRVK